MHPSYRHAMNMLDANYPQLATLYDHMMTTARIVTPPKLEVMRRVPMIGVADELNDAIYLDSKFVNHQPKNLTRVVIAHENGHLLAEHKQVDAAIAPHYARRNEQEADRIAVHLTGSHDDVSSMRVMANESVHRGLSSRGQSYQPLATMLQRAVGYFDGRKQQVTKKAEKAWQDYVGHYGTPEELEANIRGVDLNDRTYVDALIARRNHKTNPELG